MLISGQKPDKQVYMVTALRFDAEKLIFVKKKQKFIRFAEFLSKQLVTGNFVRS